MRTVLLLTLAALLVSLSYQAAPVWCKPEIFIDRVNNYRQNPGQLADYIESRILKKINCSTRVIPDGSDGNGIGLTVGSTAAEGCPRIAQTIKWLRDCPHALKSGAVIPAPVLDNAAGNLISTIVPTTTANASQMALKITELINLQVCPAASEYDTAHVAAVGSTNGVLNKGCPVTNVLKYDIGTSKASREHSVYQIGLSGQTMTHTGGTPSTAGLNNRLQLHNIWVGSIAENIIDAKIVKDQDPAWTQAQKDADNCNNAIAWWHVDSGVATRGHFSNSVNCNHDVLGAGIESYQKTVPSIVNGAVQNVQVWRDRMTEFFTKAGSCRNLPINLTQIKSQIGFANVPNSKIISPCAGVVDT